jgi:hypothetical protein
MVLRYVSIDVFEGREMPLVASQPSLLGNAEREIDLMMNAVGANRQLTLMGTTTQRSTWFGPALGCWLDAPIDVISRRAATFVSRRLCVLDMPKVSNFTEFTVAVGE